MMPAEVDKSIISQIWLAQTRQLVHLREQSQDQACTASDTRKKDSVASGPAVVFWTCDILGPTSTLDNTAWLSVGDTAEKKVVVPYNISLADATASLKLQSNKPEASLLTWLVLCFKAVIPNISSSSRMTSAAEIYSTKMYLDNWSDTSSHSDVRPFDQASRSTFPKLHQ